METKGIESCETCYRKISALGAHCVEVFLVCLKYGRWIGIKLASIGHYISPAYQSICLALRTLPLSIIICKVPFATQYWFVYPCSWFPCCVATHFFSLFVFVLNLPYIVPIANVHTNGRLIRQTGLILLSCNTLIRGEQNIYVGIKARK